MKFQHGGEIYDKEVQYDFSVNINPLGMPPESKKAAIAALEMSAHYPDPRARRLCDELAVKEQVMPQNILLGNGAAELIYALCFAIRPGKALGFAPSFAEYERAVAAAGGSMVFYDLNDQMEFAPEEDFPDRILKEAADDIDLLFLCNPNNPTGMTLPEDMLHKIGKVCEDKRIVWCVDECFLPFNEDEERFTLKHKLEQYPHLIVLRAFTKIFGMPGLRLGYGMSSNKKLLQQMRACIQPWNTSIPAQAAGVAALHSEGYLEETREIVRVEREWLSRAIQKMPGTKIYPSETNFILFQARPDLDRRLLEHGILIRDCSNFRGLEKGFFRIGVRPHAENEALMKAWKLIEEQEKQHG